MRCNTAALTTNTKASYKRGWNLFLQFNSSRTSLPISSSLLSNFIAYFFNIGYSPSSISSHISTISYIHKILGQSDPSDSFLIRKVVQGCHHSGPNKDSKLPITWPILHKLVQGLQSAVPNLHYRVLSKSFFSFGIYRFSCHFIAKFQN